MVSLAHYNKEHFLKRSNSQLFAHMALFGLSLTFFGCEFGQTPIPEEVFNNPALEEIQSPNLAIDQVMLDKIKEQKIVGMSVFVVEDGKVSYLRGYGYENYADNIQMKANTTKVRLASVSKVLTGLLAAEMALSQGLNLDVDIRTYYPQSLIQEEITLRQLLSHTAGVQHYDNARHDGLPPLLKTLSPDTNTGMEWALEYWMSNPLLASPGEEYNYSSYGFNLAAVVMEKYAGKSFKALADEYLFSLLGVTGIVPDYYWEDISHRTKGYLQSGDDIIVRGVMTDVSWKLAAGGYLATAHDMANFCQGLVSDQLDQSIKDLVWADNFTNQGEAVGYGLGFFVSGKNKNLRVSHTGSQENAKTSIVAFPNRRLCFGVLTNSEHANPGIITKALEQILL